MSKKIRRIGIVGASGIGRIHARIFNEHNIEVSSILGSSSASMQQTKQMLYDDFNIHTQAFCRLKDFLNSDIDAISICSPPEFHFQHIIEAFEQRLPVFCEKPLFWEKNLTSNKLHKSLKQLKEHPHCFFQMNTSNASFIEQVSNKLNDIPEIKNFEFEFFTQGNHRNRCIAVDLIPHGLSLLLQLLGYQDISHYKESFSNNTYECQFLYGNCSASFRFKEKPEGEKRFKFVVNENEFTRFQKVIDGQYQVFLKHNDQNELLSVEDPFCVYIKKFIRSCEQTEFTNGFSLAEQNLKLMGQLLL